MATRVQTVGSALSKAPRNARIICSPGCATPETLLNGLASRAQSWPGDTLHAGLLVGDLTFLDAVAAGNLGFQTWHIAAPARPLVTTGRVSYLPLRASDVAAWLRVGFDVCLVRVSPPDACGYCSLGPSLTYTRRAMQASRMVIAEIDPNMPRTCGDTLVHRDDLGAVVESDRPMPQYHSSASPIADLIAATVATLLPDKPTLQLGIGAIPEALARQLVATGRTASALVGMATDAMSDLVQTGAVEVIEAVELMGTPMLMKFAHRNERIRLVSSDHCHDARRLAVRPRFTSVNSALAIDLSGQAAAEGLGTRMISGIGGSVDFFEAARISDGGCRILAMTASAPDGTSRIRTALPAATPITLPSHLVDMVVTEHGIARLAGKTAAERAEALIAVAAPEHRNHLSRAPS